MECCKTCCKKTVLSFGKYWCVITGEDLYYDDLEKYVCDKYMPDNKKKVNFREVK